MYRFLLAIAFVGFLSSPALSQEIELYHPSAVSAPKQLFGVDARGLTNQIEGALIDELQTDTLSSFSVHWSPPTFQCLRVSNEFVPDDTNGVCLVKASAFQVDATVHIIKKNDTLIVSILDIMIE